MTYQTDELAVYYRFKVLISLAGYEDGIGYDY